MEHLKKEKEFTRLRDELSRQRRQLPWEEVEKQYIFDGPNGKVTLADLFDGRGQLIIYHFMFGPGWKEGCPSCSFLSDHFDGPTMHLPHRDVTLAVVSRAPIAEIEAYKKRMGWRFTWVSSFGCDFNYDCHVSFTKDQLASPRVSHNYEEMQNFPARRGPRSRHIREGWRRRRLPHLLELRTWARYAAGHVSLPGHGAEGPRRRRAGVLDGMGSAS